MSRSHHCYCIVCALLSAVLAALLLAATQPARAAAPAPVSFINDVAPILKESCFGCHGAKNPKSKFDMTKYASLRKGGTKDDPITAGKPDESYILDVLKATDKSRMPPRESGDALPPRKIALIEHWIQEGANLDAGIKPDADLLHELRVRWTPPSPPAVYPFPVTITGLAFTPDSKKLVVSGHHELLVWDVGGARLQKRIRTRARRAMAMQFLPDGNLAVAGGRPGEEGDVRIYDINAGTARVESGIAFVDGVNDKSVMLAQLLDADDEVLCLALSADGKKLASGGCDRLINVWDLSPGTAKAKLEQTIENHADWVLGLAFSPDGKHLLSGSRDKTAKVWDLAARESLLTFPDHQNTVYAVAVSKDGKRGYSVGEDAQLRTWNASADGKQLRASGGHGRAVFKLAVHPKLPLLVTCSADQTVRVWNADNGAAVRTLGGNTDYVFAVAVSPDGNLAASGAFNGEIKVWKVADGALVKAFNASPGLTPARK
jgi:WD40 repeat protein/mono/diheme cytochrome c family protein